MLEVNVKELKKVQKKLGTYKNKAPTVLYRVLNRVATNAKSNISKKTREKYNIKAADIKKTFKVKKANKSQLGAVISSIGNKVPLEKFKVNPKTPRPSKPPSALKVAVKKGENKKLLHAFIADINGNNVFQRIGNSRLPIKMLFGPAIPQIIDNHEVRNFVEEEAVKMYNKRLDHEIKRILEGNR